MYTVELQLSNSKLLLWRGKFRLFNVDVIARWRFICPVFGVPRSNGTQIILLSRFKPRLCCACHEKQARDGGP